LGEWFVKGHYAAFDGAALQILPVNVQ
jgi:hypothetical protein